MQLYQPELAGASGGRLGPLYVTGPGLYRHRALLLLRDRNRLETTELFVSARLLALLLRPGAQIEGVDYHLADATLVDEAQRAASFMLVLPPLGNLTNPFYRVHPRRNDRIIAVEPELGALFPDVDFALCGFTGHALGVMAATSPERFIKVRRVLMDLWIARMRELLNRLPSCGVLIDPPAPDWLPRPSLNIMNVRRVAVDPQNLVASAGLLRQSLGARPF